MRSTLSTRPWHNFLIALSLFALTLSPSPSSSQEVYKLEELFMEAEGWFYFQDYKTSLPLYLRVHEEFPENDNISYKIGFCYLNLDGQKQQAIPYLKEAAANTTFNYTRESFYQTKAPVDAIFYLGNAYLVNNQFDKALEAYQRFRNKVEGKRGLLSSTRNFDFAYLKKQIEACRHAKKMIDQPVSFSASNVGRPVNTPLSEYNPVVSGDGKTLIYTAEKKFYTGIFMSTKENGQWGTPVNLLPQLGIDGDCETTSLSSDGKELYLYREDDLDGNLYVSYFEDGSWSKIQKLGENINTEYWESHAFIAHGGEKLYFTSNRPGGYGDLDIYVSQRQNDGSWGQPTNLGPTINTPWREDTPFLTDDGESLFFSSEGHYNMGGYDVLVAYRTTNGWTEPQNLGYPINTTDHDRFFVPVEKGNKAFYARYHNNPPGGRDIFRYRIDLPAHIDYIDVEGVITYDNPRDKNEKSYKIHVIDSRDDDTLVSLNPSEPQGRFDYTLKDNYLIMETPRLADNEQYLISKKVRIREHYLNPQKLETTDEIASREKAPEIRLENQVFKVQPGQKVLPVTMKLLGGEELRVNTFRQDSLVNTEQFTLDPDQEEFTYRHTPGKKPTKLTFQLSDSQGRIHTQTAEVLIEQMQAEKPSTAKDSAKLKIVDRSWHLEDGQKKVNLHLEMEKGSSLEVSTYQGEKLVNEETFKVESDEFTYPFTPGAEQSRLVFSVTDPQQRLREKSIVITQQPFDGELQRLMGQINQYKGNELMQRLRELEDQELSTEQYLKALTGADIAPSVPPAQLDALLYSLMLMSGDTPEQFLKQLQNLASDNLEDYLEYLAGQEIQTKETLISKLKAAAGEPLYSEKELRDLFIRYLDRAYEPEDLRTLAMDIAGIDVEKLFGALANEAADIASAPGLMDVIRKKEWQESQRIIAWIKGLDLSGVETGTSTQAALEALEKQKEPGTRPWLIYAIAGLALLILLLVMFRRRKQKSRTQN